MEMVTAAALLVGGALLGIGLRIEERRRSAPSLPPAAGGPGAGEPAGSVTVLLPVRDEERNLLSCVEALLALAGRPSVRVIDDGSVDATASLAAAAAAREPRLTPVAAGPLPPGWRGKVHALAAGARGAGSAWLLLTDADVRLRPEALDRALAAAACRRLDAVSLAGCQQARGLAENLLTPGVFALLDALLGDWGEAADSGGEPVANGQFLLLRREAWEASGGFEAVRAAAMDDVAMAALLRRHGYRTGFFRAKDLLSVRMYQGFREAVRGWRRNLGGLLGRRPALTMAALAALALPALALAGAAAAGRGVAAALLWSAGAAASGLLRAGSCNRPAYALLYPLDALLVAAVLALGVLDHRRGRLLSWKGREMRV
ncbi:MAG TPA: glycosyltransferase [Thermoanaerobaculia bacterium]|nr:glycosyltransferase [Thermoanaerobaculia bacterium]